MCFGGGQPAAPTSTPDYKPNEAHEAVKRKVYEPADNAKGYERIDNNKARM